MNEWMYILYKIHSTYEKIIFFNKKKSYYNLFWCTSILQKDADNTLGWYKDPGPGGSFYQKKNSLFVWEEWMSIVFKDIQ